MKIIDRLLAYTIEKQHAEIQHLKGALAGADRVVDALTESRAEAVAAAKEARDHAVALHVKLTDVLAEQRTPFDDAKLTRIGELEAQLAETGMRANTAEQQRNALKSHIADANLEIDEAEMQIVRLQKRVNTAEQERNEARLALAEYKSKAAMAVAVETADPLTLAEVNAVQLGGCSKLKPLVFDALCDAAREAVAIRKFAVGNVINWQAIAAQMVGS